MRVMFFCVRGNPQQPYSSRVKGKPEVNRHWRNQPESETILRYRDRSQVLLLLEHLTPYQGSDVCRVLSMRLFSIISGPLDRSCMVLWSNL